MIIIKIDQFSKLLLVAVTAVCLLTLTVMSPAFAQSADPGAIGEIYGDAPPGQKIAIGDVEPGQETGNSIGCTSDFASGERTNNPNCSDDDDDE